MSFEFGNAIATMLGNNAAIAAALPGGFYWEFLPPNHAHAQDSPAAVWRIANANRPMSMAGMLSHRECVMEIEFVGAGPEEAVDAYNAIEDLMATKDNQTATTIGSVKVNSLVLSEFVTRSEPVNDGSGNEICHFTTTIAGDLILEE